MLALPTGLEFNRSYGTSRQVFMRHAKSGSASDEQAAPRFRIVHQFPNPSDENAWRECLSRSDWPSHYTSPEFFAEPFWDGKQPFAVLALDGDKVIAVLTGLHEDGCVISGKSSRPQICFDRTASRSRAAQALARGLLAEGGAADLVAVFAWAPLDSFRQMGFRTATLEGSVILDLSRGSEVIFSQLHPNRRRNVRYAMKQGVEIFQASSRADFLSFYEVYQQWRQTSRKAIVGEVVPFSILEQALTLKENRILFLARYQGKIIAGDIFRFYPGGIVEASANSSFDEFLRLKPNDLLVWKAVEWGCEAGFTRMSLCGSHHFLREYGGAVVPIYRHRRDATWLRRHDLLEVSAETCRKFLRSRPAIDRTIRRLLGKN